MAQKNTLHTYIYSVTAAPGFEELAEKAARLNPLLYSYI